MKKFGKIKYAILFTVLLFGLAACDGAGKGESGDRVSEVTASNEGLQGAAASKESEGSAEAQESTETQKSTEAQEDTDMQEGNQTVGESGRVLVAYFSATGTTKKLAEYAAEIMGADLYEIVPEEPYTEADLNYHDSNSRTSIEMNDATIKPAISGSVEDMAGYDIVFIAYPIWWGDAPHIMDTFMESYDFSGKTMVPFCTSGSSGIGSSAKELHEYTDDTVTWLDGARLKSSTSKEEIADWIKGLSLEIAIK